MPDIDYNSLNYDYWLDGFQLPDPRLMSAEELRTLFLQLSNEFTSRLVDTNDINQLVQLEKLQEYLKRITTEIEAKDRQVYSRLASDKGSEVT